MVRLVDLLDDWPLVGHLGLVEAARRFGMTPAALDQALVRAVRAGRVTRKEARPWTRAR
jgi:hypothetical protein